MKISAINASMQFVFTWAIHPVLGNTIEAYAVNCLSSGCFSYEFYKLAGNTVNDYFPDASLSHREILALADKYSEETLQKKFKSGQKKSRTFFEDLDPELLDNHIRPYIDKHLYKIAGLLHHYQMPLYYKGLKNERIQEKPLLIMPDMAQALFIFDRQAAETHYSLKMQYQGQQVALNNVEARFLSQKPCLLLIEDKIFRFLPEWEGKRLLPFFTREFVIVPKSAERKYFQSFVLGAIRDYPVEASGFSINDNHQPPIPYLSVECNWLGHWVLQLYFKYPQKVQFHAYDAEKGKTIFNEVAGEFNFTRIKRHQTNEAEIIALLKAMGLIDKRGDGFYLHDPQELNPEGNASGHSPFVLKIIEWLGNQQSFLKENNIGIKHQIGKEFFHIGVPELILDVSEKTDWFDLNAVVVFGEHRIPFLRLKNFILQGKREFPLPDGSLGLIPEEWIEKFHDVFRFATTQGDSLKLKKHHFPLMEEISGNGIQVPDISAAMEHYLSPEIPAVLNAELRPYQVLGFRWMCFLQENNLGGCLADDMGLGKTLQTLALLAHVHNAGGDSLDPSGEEMPAEKPSAAVSLIVMPLSLIHNWVQEIRRFAPFLKVLQHSGPARAVVAHDFKGYDLVLTSYGTVRSDGEMLSGYLFKYIILDESQVIKNAESKIFHAVKALRGEYRLVLTGTPIENSLSDLWSQFSFINPGMLGSLRFFREEYVQPIERNQDNVKRLKLQKLIEPFILRRTKPEVASELPALTQVTRYCEMTSEHRSLYETRKSQVRNMILEQVERQGMDKTRFMILSNLMKLRMIANHPVLTDEDYPFDSGKFLVVKAHLENLLLEGHKVLIFSQFVKHLNIYRNYFEKEGLTYSLLTGKVPENERMQLIKEFQEDPTKQLFLISLKAGGVGLNLTGADYVFILDPWWNPAVELQAINRAHRIGQDKKVFVYKFITSETVEEKILLLQQKKSDLAGMFIHTNNPLKDLDPADLKALME